MKKALLILLTLTALSGAASALTGDISVEGRLDTTGNISTVTGKLGIGTAEPVPAIDLTDGAMRIGTNESYTGGLFHVVGNVSGTDNSGFPRAMYFAPRLTSDPISNYSGVEIKPYIKTGVAITKPILGLNINSVKDELAGTPNAPYVVGLNIRNQHETGIPNTIQILLGQGSPTQINGLYSIYSICTFDSYYAGNIGIGTSAPQTNLHLYTNNTTTEPQLRLEQAGTGDTAIRFSHSAATAQDAAIGIDQSDNKNIKISNTNSLTSAAYPDANTMMRIHTETGSEGIIDLDNQSKVRAWRSAALTATNTTAVNLAFDNETYDRKNEFDTGTGRFTAKEAGYYLVTATSGITSVGGNAFFIYLMIYKNGAVYSNGPRASMRAADNGAIVTDVVELAAGNTIDIYIYQSSTADKALRTGETTTYVSIHKIS